MFFVKLLIGYSCLVTFQDLAILPSNVVFAQLAARINRYRIYQDQVTWDDAYDACSLINTKLAEITTYDQQKLLRTYTRENDLLPKGVNAGYWIGGRKRNGAWRWDNSGLRLKKDELFQAGWHFGEPNGAPGDQQDCMELQYKDKILEKSLSWNNLGCDEVRGYICESWDNNPIPPES